MQARITGLLLCAIGLLYLSGTLCGQVPPAAPPAPQPFVSEPYILKTSSTVTSMNADGTGTRVITLEIAIQSEASLRDLSVLTLLFSSQSEHADFVYARVVHSDGTTQ